MDQFHHFNTMLYGFPVDVLAVFVGLIVLVFGRKLFWLFVGGMGFLAGLHGAMYVFFGYAEWIVALIGLFTGILGVVFALFLQRAAVVVAGFFAGGHLVVSLLDLGGIFGAQGFWLPFLAGAIIGGIGAAVFFDWALIILSSLTGAVMISQALSFGPAIKALVLLALITAGIVIQTRLMKRNPA